MPTPIQMDYYTDPLCSWCYAAEGLLTEIKSHFKDRVEIHYKMFPLFEDIREVMQDPSRLWSIADRYRIVSKKTGVFISNKVWSADPPQSAWPACEAVKAASQQGSEVAGQFLGLLRIAVMIEGKNIARREVQMEIAAKVGMNMPTFGKDLAHPRRREEVIADMKDAARENVESRPHFIITNTQGDKVAIAGPRNFTLFKEAIDAIYMEQPEI